MAGRAARYCIGGLAVAVAAVAFPLRAAEPVPPQAPIGFPPGVAPHSSTVTAFQRPPGSPEPPAVLPAPTPPSGIDPFLPQPPTRPEAILPDGSRVNLPEATRQQIRFAPRYAIAPNFRAEPIDKENNVTRWIYTGGIILNVVYLSGTGPTARLQEVEFATDNVVAWVKQPKEGRASGSLNTTMVADDRTEVELYLSGNVIIRSLSSDTVGNRTVDQVFRAAEVYYDVNRHRAVSLNGDMELRIQDVPERVHIQGKEVWQLSRNEYRLFQTNVYSSKRPAQPGLRITGDEATLIQQNTVRRNIFGRPYRDVRTGELDVGNERILTTERVRHAGVRHAGLLLAAVAGGRQRPAGPAGRAGVRHGHDLRHPTLHHLGRLPVARPARPAGAPVDAQRRLPQRPRAGPGHRLQLHWHRPVRPRRADRRDRPGGPPGVQPAVLRAVPALRHPRHGRGRTRRRPRPGARAHPDFRGRAQWRHNQDVYERGTTFVRVLTQVQRYLSDQNFFEQYYKIEFDMQPNQETFAYLYGATGNLGGSLLAQANWSATGSPRREWLPRADGYLIGQSFCGTGSIYSARATSGTPGCGQPRPTRCRCCRPTGGWTPAGST